MEQEEKSASKRRKTLERELEWVRMAPKARQAKGKARLNSYEQMLNQEQKEREDKLEIFIPNGPRLGNKVIEAQHVKKAFGEKVLFNDPKKTVYEVISQGNETIRMGGRDVNARAYISRFNFSGTDQSKLCSVLSGGERNRLQLALALKQEGNVLLLDEPTNDIDVNTLRALEEGLEAFAGCAVVISHDRWFLDRICTHILAFEGNGEVFFFEGSYSEYEINKARRLGDTEIKKGRYRKLMEE